MLRQRLLAVCITLIVAILVFPALPNSALAVAGPAGPVAESRDFATQVLRDPWDMSEFTDISQYLNGSGQRSLVQNISVAGGVFSAQSTAAKDADFYPLFPGYVLPGNVKLIQPGKAGVNYPIDSSTYKCLSIAMKVDSGPASASGGSPDQFQIFWFGDERQNDGGPWGFSPGIALYPEAFANQPTHSWRLYSVNLANVVPPSGLGLTPWNGQSVWRGLRIDPTLQSNVTFQVDWVRLTDCSASNQQITWPADPSVNAIWLRPSGTTRDIRVATGVDGSSGSYTLDTQGIAPGTYTIELGTATSCCISTSAAPLVINQAPIANFTQPSFPSGADYATQAGNPWDFSDAADGSVANGTASYQNGVLDIVTPSGPAPAGVDVQVKLNTPVPASSSEYRYLTFKMNTDWGYPWQNVPQGMIARWIWSIQGAGGGAFRCTLVSYDIPYDIGTQVYTIDLGDASQGRAEASQGQCPAPLPSWSSSGSVLGMRFDPNENITVLADPITNGNSFHQQIDWIRLTKENQVTKGSPYLVQLALNKPAAQIGAIDYFYTTSPQQPTQHAAQAVSASPPGGARRAYLPMLSNGDSFLPASANPLSFVWNTSSVAAGTYYLCARLDDGVNTSTMCSQAPVKVTP